jgi:ribonuclease HII
VILLQTIKEIVEMLRILEEPDSWMDTLKEDNRAGVKGALARWQRQYDKKKLVMKEYELKKAFDRSYAPFWGAMVAGVDEAGRGPLAGPVVCAAVILPEETLELVGLDDSKKIAKTNRQQLAEKIRNVAVAYSVHIQSAAKIDEMNIYAATRNSMELAVRGLEVKPDFVIADAMAIATSCPTASVIQGDAKSLAVAAASILAKTTRDAIMDQLHIEHPVYNFLGNAGYGTAEHVKALHTYGPCEHHRKSFEPVKSLVLTK